MQIINFKHKALLEITRLFSFYIMREIKFRAWNSYEKQFIANGDVLDLYYSAKCNALMFDNDNYELPNNIIFLQYTGLKDKNGKEIYEGDIIIQNEEEWDPQIVEYGIQRVDAFDVMGWSIWDFYEDINNKTGKRLQSNIEIIGNIYENPELSTYKEIEDET
jgi:uncharacterized phage protein (TIGR01671 family)